MNREILKLRNQKIKELHDAGISPTAIAAQYGITRRAVYYVLAQTGKCRRKEEHDA